MNKSSLLVALVAIGSVAVQQIPSSNPSTSAGEEILKVVKDFNEAFAGNDVPQYFSYIDPGITVITPANPYRVEGVADDREEFEFSLRSGVSRVGHFQEMQPKVQLFGSTAVVTYFSRGSYGPEGKEKVAYYKETDVLTKRANGWKIVHIHLSASP